MPRLVFTGGAVFDGVGAAPADVAVADGRFVAVGAGLDGDERVDVTGKLLLPGLFDCHVHVVLSRVDALHNMHLPFSYQFYVAARNLRTMQRLGITTVRDAHGADLGIKRALADGLIAGPRLQISVAMLSPTGGHGDDWTPYGGRMSAFSGIHPGRPSGIVDGPDEMRRVVREILRAGADVLKVATSGGVLSPESDPRQGHFREDELAVLMAEAAAAGRAVMAHAQAAEGVKAAVRAGVRSIEHGIFLDDEAIDLMLAHGTWLVPTLSAPRGLLAAVDSGAITLAERAVRKLRDVVDAHMESFRRAMAAGVKVAMGTDAPTAPFGTNLDELDLMSTLSDMRPADALVAATSSAAALLGLGGELGAVEPGKRADLVVLDGTSLALAGLASRVEQVWQDGQRVH